MIVGESSQGKPAACAYDSNTREMIFMEYSNEASAANLVKVAVDSAGIYAYVGTGTGKYNSY